MTKYSDMGGPCRMNVEVRNAYRMLVEESEAICEIGYKRKPNFKACLKNLLVSF
jgi:hypothetical protein